jgi:uncharacterized protein (DUF3820 family)
LLYYFHHHSGPHFPASIFEPMPIMEDPISDKTLLLKLIDTPMPFGKYKGRMLIDLPEAYLLWFQKEGFPNGQIGQLLQLALEIEVSGSKSLVRSLKNG